MSSYYRPKEKSQTREDELAEAIQMYLCEHPQAMDTVEGIAEWWLMRQQIRTDVTALTKALDRLVELDIIEAIGIGVDARYRLKRRDSALPPTDVAQC